MVESLVIDGARYERWRPSNEEEFEKVVTKHIKTIFGKKSIYFNIKQKLTSIAGIDSIPDGFLIDFDSKKFYLVEIEISTHPVYEHIVSQLGKFIAAIENDENLKELRDVIYKEIQAKPIREAKIKEIVGGEIHKSITDIVSNPSLLVLIDEKTKELEVACKALSIPIQILVFKTYARKEVGLPVHAHLFDTDFRFEGLHFKTKHDMSKRYKNLPASKRDDFVKWCESFSGKEFALISWQELFEIWQQKYRKSK